MDIQNVSVEQLKQEWDLWMKSDEEEIENVSGVKFHYEDIHTELNRRGEGLYCAV